MKYTTLIIFLFIVFISYSQKKKDVQLLTVNYPTETIKTEVLQGVPTFKAEEELSYSWYKSNKILETIGGYDGKILHGKYSSNYLNNALKEKGIYKKGLKVGRWIKWYSDGKIMEIVNWKNGKRHGVYKYFDDKGMLVTEANYTKGKLNGKVISYLGGKQVSIKKYRNDRELIPRAKKIKVIKVKQTSKDLKKPGIFKRLKESNKDRRDERKRKKELKKTQRLEKTK